MFLRTAIFAALLAGASLPAAADPVTAQDCEDVAAYSVQPRADGQWLIVPRQSGSGLQSGLPVPVPELLGDVVNGRGPDERGPLLAQFAVYNAFGNRDGMRLVSDRLRQFGATRQELEDFAAYAPLHTRSPTQPVRAEREVQQGWYRSQ